MRLGQLARKYDVSTQEIIAYLKKIDATVTSFHPNAKLDEKLEQMVMDHFDVLLDPDAPNAVVMEEETLPVEPEKIAQETNAEEIVDPVTHPVVEEALPDLIPPVISEKSKEEIIETDRLLELVESEDSDVDLSKITLIKAPKKKLDGLKVLGKIELPEVKKPEPKEKEKSADRNAKSRQTQQSEEEREKQRLWAKKKKEENEARLERKRKEKEKEELKALKEAHYKQKLQRTKQKAQKPKAKAVQVIQEEPIVQKQVPQPKTLLGKFWRWLNT
jgi:hypothetical protein